MRKPQPQSRQPRRGQALLLAVLIMIFAALLSASFIAVVSVNLNQTARQTDKNRAVVSAKAGLDYAVNQLAYSDKGERWKPEIPKPGDRGYGFYYSSLDRAQGWADQYAKFPDPRNVVAQNGGPQFLVRVERIPLNTQPNQPDFDRAGSIKISVIGLSPEDPSAYSRSVAYFGGYKNSPIARTMRAVSNWDFKNNVVPRAEIGRYNPTASTITFTRFSGDFLNIARPLNTVSPMPFMVTISDPRRQIPARSVTVLDVAVDRTATPAVYTLTLAPPAAPLNPPPSQGERVELAANLGAPVGIDYANSGTPIAFAPAQKVRLSDSSSIPNSVNEVDGARVNGGLVWAGDLLTTKLREPSKIADSTEIVNAGLRPGSILAPGTIQTSGVLAFDPNTPVTPVVNVAKTDGTNPGTLQPSNNAGIFLTGTPNYQLVNDAWNRLRGIASNNGTRNVEDFRPPALDSKESLQTYYNLTRFSPTNPTAVAPASALPRHALDGYGEGIYIDNVQDKERLYINEDVIIPNGMLDTGEDTNGNGILDVGMREMPQSEFMAMLMSSRATAASYDRTGTPLAANIAAASLEQQHLRGWVGPDEFRARGVEIELVNDYNIPLPGDQPGLIITRDARDDNTATNLTAALGPVQAKTWKSVAGAQQPGVYRLALPWPVNGVVFAEGNVRIKGAMTTAPPRSLTVVSMNNIYIEDSLSAGTRKVLLLAKKNVVMNPTRVLGRPDAQTTVTTAGTVVSGPPQTQTLTVPDGLSFQVGDYVQTFSTTGAITGQGYVVTPAPTADTINLSSVIGGAVTGDFVRTANATVQTATNFPFSAITSIDSVIQRRFKAPSATLSFASNSNASLTTGMEVRGIPNGAFTMPAPLLLSNKTATNPADSNVVTADKLMRVVGSTPANNDSFPGANPASATIADIRTGMTPHNAPEGWQYTVTPAANPYDQLPFFYLAGVGNRFNYNTAVTDPNARPAPERRKNISNLVYSIPLATSIGVRLNSVPSIITNEVFNIGLRVRDTVGQFGFSPDYATDEDILTSDQSFYQSPANAALTTIDTRSFGALTVGVDNPLVWRQSEFPAAIATTIAANPLPTYRMGGLKVENVTLAPTNSVIQRIDPPYSFNVNAFVYAQTGSWLVIPGPLFDARLRGTLDTTSGVPVSSYLDLNNNNMPDTGEFLDVAPTGYGAGDHADLNRNGTVIDPSEIFALTRYSRFNYSITFTGAIAENYTPIVNNAGTGPTAVRGVVTDWMTKWATSSYVALPTPTVTNARLRYIFDSSVVRGLLEDDPNTVGVDETDTGFRLPQTPQVFNVS